MQKLRNTTTLGNNLRTIRKKCRLTQEQVVARLNLLNIEITRSYYSRYETGELNIPVETIVALRYVFQCSYDELFQNIRPDIQ
ncbi:transcriptional regulator with XRE-family HTH domain [Catenibacillus scindens]|uniref:Transcriptional regulator with XRE-family HTH domain n=1 Tax=Catenibacillus scindens TaxID=673271 RepID=A0A7W8M4M4_9FIRM|nr:helix-turn-helix transcriptional regulator [Catenibacillus scindens]MBB5264160.1 transcriptional regulator with XRE-family HTH domain [Catenibacillus scindens]